MFRETHPILGTRDIQRAIVFYTHQLGFELAFGDKADPPNYVGFQRDAVELHMQFQFEHEMGTIRLRFLVEDPDAIFNEYRLRGCLRSSGGRCRAGGATGQGPIMVRDTKRQASAGTPAPPASPSSPSPPPTAGSTTSLPQRRTPDYIVATTT